MRRGNSYATLESFGKILNPKEADEPILAKPIRDALNEWLTEIWAKEKLEKVGLKPRLRALFDGPPGVGKTTLAHHLSARLGLPMLAVYPEKLIDCFLGSSGKNIAALFEIASRQDSPFVLFFDEFDSLAIKRKAADSGASEERNSWVNTLLQCIERHEGFIIAATNRGSEIDPAIWRRFDIHIEIEVPGQFERKQILARYLKPYGMVADELEDFAKSFETASPALMRQFCESLKRQFVIGKDVGWDMKKTPTISRVLAAIQPHPDIGKPQLWSKGSSDTSIKNMTWPLLMLSDVKKLNQKRKSETGRSKTAEESNVFHLHGTGGPDGVR